METRANFILLGGVAIAGAVFIMLFALWLTGAGWRQSWNVYDVVFQGPVRGLADGGEVRFNGIKVGEITRLSIDRDDPSRVIARVRVLSETPVRADSDAQLEAVGLTGVNLIQLSAGSSESPRLQQRMGQAPPRIAARPGVIEGLLTEENSQRLTRLLNNMEAISAVLAREDSVVFESAKAARDLSAAAQAITRLSDASAADLAAVSARTTAVLTQAERAVAEAELALRESRTAAVAIGGAATIASEQTLPQLGDAADDLRRLSARLSQLARDLEAEPGSFAQRRRPTVEVAP